MMAPDLSEWLRMPEVAFEVFIGVHKDDKITCDRIGAVPRRLCADPQVDYIELGNESTESSGSCYSFD